MTLLDTRPPPTGGRPAARAGHTAGALLLRWVLGSTAALLLTILGLVVVLLVLLSGGPQPQANLGGPSSLAAADIPPTYLAAYQAAARRCPGLRWQLLAAVGKVETDHGRLQAPGVASNTNSAGAAGPMQFLSSTWATAGVDGNRDGRTDVYDPADAIPAAADYLCSGGAGRGPAGERSALFSYNHAGWYVDKVEAQAAAYTDTLAPTGPTAGGWGSPITGAVLTQPYCASNGHESCHPGVDLAAPAGTPLRAVHPGTVVFAGPASGYGDHYICTDIGSGLVACYGHASAQTVHTGQHVQAGETVALEGSEGYSTGPHLHFEIRTGLWGPTQDPVAFLAQRGVRVP